MHEISHALRKLVSAFDEMSIPSMLIGGWALPAYGRIRATQDIDIAIAAEFDDIVRIHERLGKLGYQLPSTAQRDAPLFVVTDLQNQLEIEVWVKPDGVTFDSELLSRRIRVRPFGNDFEMYAIGPEDFIVNKLARGDRSTQDEQDVLSVLDLQKSRLDYRYLQKRARRADVGGLLQTLMDRMA